jgi:hypothetical protein
VGMTGACWSESRTPRICMRLICGVVHVGATAYVQERLGKSLLIGSPLGYFLERGLDVLCASHGVDARLVSPEPHARGRPGPHQKPDLFRGFRIPGTEAHARGRPGLHQTPELFRGITIPGNSQEMPRVPGKATS